MKILAAIAALLFAVSRLSAQTPPPATPADAKPADAKAANVVKPADSKSTPAANTPAKKDDKKKPAPEPIIPGLTIARANGTFLGLEVAGGNFKLSFYDKKKKPMAPDVSRATARWPNRRSDAGDNRTVLNPGGNALVGAKPVVPPFNFLVRLTLLQGEGDDTKTVESYAVDFHG